MLHIALLGWLAWLQTRPAPDAEIRDAGIEMLFEAPPEPPPVAAVPDPPSATAAPELPAVAPHPDPDLPVPEPVPPVVSEEPVAAPAPPSPVPALPVPAPVSSVPPRPTPVRPPPRPRTAASRPSPPASPAVTAPAVPDALSARASPPPAAAAPPAPTPAAPASTADPGWRAALGNWLAARKRYPDQARQRGDEGTVGIRFTVDAAGQVLDVAISRSSGSALLDDAARSMLAGQRVPPFPPGMARAQMTVPVNIRFQLDQ